MVTRLNGVIIIMCTETSIRPRKLEKYAYFTVTSTPPINGFQYYILPSSRDCVFFIPIQKYVIYIYFYWPNNIILCIMGERGQNIMYMYNSNKFNAKTLVCVCLLLTAAAAARARIILYTNNSIISYFVPFHSFHFGVTIYIHVFFPTPITIYIYMGGVGVK